MAILKQLQKNKGTVSSALGKELAEKVLRGDTKILEESVELVNFNDRNVRAGAAKIIEKVAEKKPDLVAPYLEKLLPALNAPEPQTRWMIIHAFGYCAKQKPGVAAKALDKAKEFLEADSGACLWDRSILYLGYLGVVSKENTKQIFPMLEKAFSIPGQTKTVLESMERMIPVLGDKEKRRLLEYATKYLSDNKPSVKSKANKILKTLE